MENPTHDIQAGPLLVTALELSEFNSPELFNVMDYRREIDGLRAIAVLMVFAHHLGIQQFSGGYVGVDIFFVISGFVIFRSILTDLENKTFSVRRFYQRRIRRILPALIVTILFCFTVGLWVLTPNGYIEMANTALSAIFSVSNIYFDDNAGNYFATTAKNIPLLHTWSLGVEEQFYLLVPLLFLAHGQKCNTQRIVRLLLVIMLLTFIYNLVAIYVLGKMNHAFYLPMARLWEIAIGGILAVIERSNTKITQNWRSILTAMGLIGIATSAIALDGETQFPGFAALLPVFSVALLILSAPKEGEPYYRLLTVPPMLFFGRISYSLYLFHWPLIVFTGLYFGRDLFINEKTLIFVIAVFLSTLTWKYVEQPFRQRQGKLDWPDIRNILGVAITLILVISGASIWSNGFSSRINPEALQVEILLNKSRDNILPCKEVESHKNMPNANLCSPYQKQDNIDYILWGDSHAGMLQPEVSTGMHNIGMSGIYAGMADCQPLFGVHTTKKKNRAECAAFAHHIFYTIKREQVSTIILASRWATLSSPVPSPGDVSLSKKLFDDENSGASISFYAALERTVKRITEAGTKVIIVGPVPEIDFDVPDMLTRVIDLGLNMPEISRIDFNKRQSIILKALRKVNELDDVIAVYPHEILCDEQHCQVAQGLHVLYQDDDHLSPEGAGLVVPLIIKAAVFQE